MKMAVVEVPAPIGLQSAGAGTETAMHWSVTETFFMPKGDDFLSPMLCKSFELAEDLSEVVLHLQEGVQFHDGWGEFTAEDAAWNMNDANGGTTPTSIHAQAGDFNGLFGSNPWEVVDAYTVRAKFSAFDSRWASRQLNLAGEALGIVSKRAYDEMGKDWFMEHIVGTGPYKIADMTKDDKAVTEAVDTHWRQAGKVSQISWLEIPEPSVRVAMLRTGEVDSAFVPLRDIKALVESGLQAVISGDRADEIGVVFGGNLWETNHVVTGEQLELPTYTHDIPWIGNPFTPNDKNNPAGMDDMEQARLVRWALALAIDREVMNEALQDGLGWPVYILMFSPKSPYWQDRWEVPYDLDKAKELLAEAGFPGGGFDVPLYGQPSPEYYTEQALAIGGMWEKLGLNVSVLHYDYSIIRPSLVQRTQTFPFMKTCGESISTQPWFWPKGLTLSSLSRGGFSCSVEAPEIAQTFLKVSKEPDLDKIIEMNNEIADFMYHWMIVPGAIAVPTYMVVNPKSIASWDMEIIFQAQFRCPECIVPAR